ncbi:MAG: glycosyltransferase family 2 protein [Candidatus Omnitrophota bacterium]|nr:glycosyltransferase family 2 protein [Candidatus Omnitrophota bacterium]
MNNKRLSIIIVSYNAAGPLEECVKSIIDKTRNIDYEIIVMDNASIDGSADVVKIGFPQVNLIVNQENVGYAAANNAGIRRSSGEYVLILNSDVIVLDNLKCLVDFMDGDSSIGIAGCAVYDEGMRLQPYSKRYPGFFSELYKLTVLSVKDVSELFPSRRRDIEPPSKPIDVDWIEGCFMLARKSALEKAGLMDERYFLYYEDVDLCRMIKISLDLRVVYNPCAKVQHMGSRSTAFSNAFYLKQYYESCVSYFGKHSKAFLCPLFSLVCVFCWIALFTALALANLVLRRDDFTRKIEMLKYVIKQRFSGRK